MPSNSVTNSVPKTLWNTEIWASKDPNKPREGTPKKVTITKDLEIVSNRGIVAIFRELFHIITLDKFNPAYNDKLMIATLKSKIDDRSFDQLSSKEKMIFAGNVEAIRQNVLRHNPHLATEFATVEFSLNTKMAPVNFKGSNREAAPTQSRAEAADRAGLERGARNLILDLKEKLHDPKFDARTDDEKKTFANNVAYFKEEIGNKFPHLKGEFDAIERDLAKKMAPAGSQHSARSSHRDEVDPIDPH
ncbi:MAG: hypothetical protein V4492_06215, partial [Chlamydiota bacterium]